MADNRAVLKLTTRWARAATEASSHERDYFVEAIRDLQRKKEAQRDRLQGSRTEAVERSD
jgi:hypothetical protein